MKYLRRLYESFDKAEIDNICEKYDIEDYTINPDGSIDVDGSVYLYEESLIKLPLQFNIVRGWFDCSENLLTSLKGSPKEVNGYFDCEENKLTSFEYIPKRIGGDFNCCWNDIRNFEYFPNYIGGDFDCFNNPIDEIWILFEDSTKIELLNDFDIFRDEDTDTPSIVMDRLNDFLLTIGRDPVEKVDRYKNI